MTTPYAARKALVEAFDRSETLRYDALRDFVLSEVERQSGLKYIPFDDLLDEAFERDVIEYVEPGILKLHQTMIGR